MGQSATETSTQDVLWHGRRFPRLHALVHSPYVWKRTGIDWRGNWAEKVRERFKRPCAIQGLSARLRVQQEIIGTVL